MKSAVVWLLVAALSAISACTEDLGPTTLKVVFPVDATAEEKVAIVYGAEEWNRKIGGPVFDTSGSTARDMEDYESGHARCDHVYVKLKRTFDGTHGEVVDGGCWSRIIFARDELVRYKQLQVHEFGHALGLPDTSDTSDVMYGGLLWDRELTHISREHLQQAAAFVGISLE